MKQISETEVSMFMNNATYTDYYDRLKLIATSLFTWDGLDEVAGTGASRFLELCLYNQGRACFIKDDKLGYLALNANPSDKLNVYQLPEKIQAWSVGYTKTFDFDNTVFIMNNELMLPTRKSIELFAYRLYETERTIDVNLKAQKTPVLLEGDKKTMLTLKNAYMQYDGNNPFIFGSKTFELGSKINALKTDAPYLIDKLELHKHEIWNECLTYLGIDNANTDKKERLITDEVESNNEIIKYYLNCFYKTRKKACDEINKKYFMGAEQITIKLNDEVMELLGMDTKNFYEDVEDEMVGEVYE
ncbi:MAG: hypothetical protein J6T10_10590 [Methanobrevibacter sp.]|nr:hypothetical protein [Methanobrevibacter sp.]